MENKLKINIGDKIQDWIILDNKIVKQGTVCKIKCQCKCGKIKLVNKYTLIHKGCPKNCGCDRHNHMKDKSKELGDKLVGTIKNNFHGTPMKIIEYKNCRDIVVEFQDEHKFCKRTSTKEFNNGRVHNPFDKTIYGVGYYGFDYMPTGKDMGDEFNRCYNVWHHMMARCYDEKRKLEKAPTYIDCEVCSEWHNFKNFSEWYLKNIIHFKNGDRTCLDKDILHKGNKVYSPKNCCFVPNEINVLFTKSDKIRGKYPIGVYYRKDIDRYIAQCNDESGRQRNLGSFKNPTDAFYAYKEFKEKYIKQVADKYKGEITDDVYNAMYNWTVEIDD